MRGTDKTRGTWFSSDDLEECPPARHPLRKIRQLVNEALASLDAAAVVRSPDFGHSSIPSGLLIRPSLIRPSPVRILFPARSERPLIGQTQHERFLSWFACLAIGAAV
jgi:hypothetical protein